MATTKANELGQFGSKLTVHNENITLDGNVHGQYAGFDSDFTNALSSNISVTGNISVSGTVDGRDVATDGTKLDGIEAAATADQTKSDIEGLGIDVPASNLTGTIPAARLSTATTQAESDDSTKIATTAYVVDKITTLIGGAPSTLNDLNELAAAINDDHNYNSTLTTALATKLPLAGGTLTGNLSFGDNDKAIFGAGSDLQIYSDGNYSYLRESNGTSGLKITSDNQVSIRKHDDENIAVFNIDGAVRFYHDNAQKFTTTSTGIDVTGKVTSTGLIGNATNFDIIQNTSDGSDNKRTRIGGGGDVVSSRGAMIEVSGNEHGNGGMLFLHAGHGGAYSQIRSYTSNTERMRIDSNGNLLVGKTALGISNAGHMLAAAGYTEFTRTATSTSSGGALNVGRNSYDGTLATFWKDGSAVGSIGTYSGHLDIVGDTRGARITDTAIIPISTSGAVQDNLLDLGYSGSRFKDLYLSSAIKTPSGDLTLDASGDIILDADSGAFRFKDAGTTLATFTSDSGSVVLYNATADKDIIFKGNDGGSTITALTLDMSDAGTAIFGGYAKFADNQRIVMGSGNDLSIYHSSSDNNSYITETGSGSLVIAADQLYIQNAARTETKAIFTTDGGVELRHNDSKKFETNSGGATVTGTLITDGLSMSDNETAYFGTGNDLRIYHDGANSYIKHALTTGWLNMPMSGSGLTIANGDFSENIASFNRNGSVDLYHNGSKKFETTSSGVAISGQLTSGTIFDADLRGGSTVLPGHAYCNTHDGTNIYWHMGTNTTSTTNKHLRLRILKSDNTYVTNTWSPSGLSVSGSVTASNGFYGDGSNLTGVGGSTAYGAVGTYVWGYTADTGYVEGDTKGSGIFPAGFIDTARTSAAAGFQHGNPSYMTRGGTACSGTWRAMGRSNSDSAYQRPRPTLWVRIS